MDDQKRFLIFIILTIGIFYAYSHFFMQKPSTANQPQKEQQEVVATEETIIANQPGKEALTSSSIEEQTVVLESEEMKLELSNRGGVISSILLKQSDLIKDKPHQVLSFEDTVIQPLFIARLGSIDFSGSELYEITSARDDVVEFTGNVTEGLELVKRVRINSEKYQVRLEFEVKNKSDKVISLLRGFDMVCGSIEPVTKREGIKNLEIDSLFTETSRNFKRKNAGKIKEREFEAGRVLWTSMKNKYFAIILDPDEGGMGVVYDLIERVDTDQPQKRPARYYYNQLRMDPFSLSPGEKRVFSFNYYIGPKELNIIKSNNRGYEQLMGFSGWFGFLIKMLLSTLIWLYGIFHNYGVAIILISVLTKVIFYPLTQKSFKSMQQMQAIQPLVAQLKEQYKDNPKKMQSETMALYKQYNVNPLGGCLPLLFQMPIFFALFRMLTGAVQLRGADFLWIKDLTMPDTIYSFGTFNVNILPLVMGFFMFLQQRMTPATDPNQKKMVMFMPVIFTVIFYNMPSGLVLYWLVNNILTLVQQYFIKKKSNLSISEEDAQPVSN